MSPDGKRRFSTENVRSLPGSGTGTVLDLVLVYIGGAIQRKKGGAIQRKKGGRFSVERGGDSAWKKVRHPQPFPQKAAAHAPAPYAMAIAIRPLGTGGCEGVNSSPPRIASTFACG